MINNLGSLRTGEFHLPKPGWCQPHWDALPPAESVWDFGRPQGRQPAAPEFRAPECAPLRGDWSCLLSWYIPSYLFDSANVWQLPSMGQVLCEALGRKF